VVAANERDRAQGMLERLVAWLRDSRAELTRVAIEKDFRVQVGDASISGRSTASNATRRAALSWST